MTLPLENQLEGIHQRVAAAEHLLVGLDYDGTLTAIVDDPTKATLG